MKENCLQTTGNKTELFERCKDFLKTEDLEENIDARTFVDLTVDEASPFADLLINGWTSDNLPVITECRHLSHIEENATLFPFTFIRAHCKPTMRRQLPYYDCFIQFTSSYDVSTADPTVSIEGANCQCPSRETQSCAHVAALMLTLTEVTPIAGTSKQCAWSRPAQLASHLDFGYASSEGYQPYTGNL